MMRDTPRTFVGAATFEVVDLTTSEKVRAVLREVMGVPGVACVTADIASGTVTVGVRIPLDRADIAAAIRRAGRVVAT
jgi:hypothetical protein